MKTYGKKSYFLPFKFDQKDMPLVDFLVEHLNQKEMFNLKRVTHVMFGRNIKEEDFAHSVVCRNVSIVVCFTEQEHLEYFEKIVQEVSLLIKMLIKFKEAVRLFTY